MSTPEIVAQDLQQPHGLAFDTEEILFVSETGAGRISKIDENGKREDFAQTGGRPMGIAFDDSGDLFVAESGRHHLLLVSPEVEMEVYAHQCHGRRLVAPRDLCFEPTGDALFSDTGRGEDDGIVYRADLDGEVEELVGGLSTPTGMVLTEDAVGLYVAESGRNRILYIELDEEGKLAEQQVLVEFEDGDGVEALRLDTRGHLLALRPGVGLDFIDAEGAVVETVALPAPQVSGMTLGGLEYDELYVAEASGGAIYRLHLEHAGQRPFAGPRAV
jgi:sugar lactone lactonase YvrE